MSLATLKSFPQLEIRRKLRFKLFKALHGKVTNNHRFFMLANRDYLSAFDQIEIPRLTALSERIVNDLSTNGIAFAHIDDFFPQGFFDQISDAFNRYLTGFNASSLRKKKSGKNVYLDVIHKSHCFTFENDPVSAYLSSVNFAAIAAHYFRMIPRYIGSSFWRTNIPANHSERIYSQMWHRDYNDRRLMKVFLYLNDVGLDQGYFEYISGSHSLGPLGHLFDRTGIDGYRVYPNPSKVEQHISHLPVINLSQTDKKLVKRSSIIKCTAPKGTLIFADTYGLHRGGYVKCGHRDMVMLTYSTNFNVHKPHFSLTQHFASQLDPFMKMVFGVKEEKK